MLCNFRANVLLPLPGHPIIIIFFIQLCSLFFSLSITVIHYISIIISSYQQILPAPLIIALIPDDENPKESLMEYCPFPKCFQNKIKINTAKEAADFDAPTASLLFFFLHNHVFYTITTSFTPPAMAAIRSSFISSSDGSCIAAKFFLTP